MRGSLRLAPITLHVHVHVNVNVNVNVPVRVNVHVHVHVVGINRPVDILFMCMWPNYYYCTIHVCLYVCWLSR